MVSIVLRRLYSHALTPNFKKGKSEVLVSCIGARSRQVSSHIFNDVDANMLCAIYKLHTVSICVTHFYRHLGNMINAKPTYMHAHRA